VPWRIKNPICGTTKGEWTATRKEEKKNNGPRNPIPKGGARGEKKKVTLLQNVEPNLRLWRIKFTYGGGKLPRKKEITSL